MAKYNTALNGLQAYLKDTEEDMFVGIANKFNLPVNDVREAAYGAVDSTKPKPIKHKARPPKSGNVKTKPECDYVKSGYVLFGNEHRDQVIKSLMEDEASRTFQDKNGNTIVFKTSDFPNGKPTFTQAGKKTASMWAALSKEEKDDYNTRCKTTLRVKKVAKNGKAVVSEVPEKVSVKESVVVNKKSEVKTKDTKKKVEEPTVSSDSSSEEKEKPKKTQLPAKKGAGRQNK